MFPDDVCVCPKEMEGGPRDSSVHQGSTQTPVSRPEDGYPQSVTDSDST